MIKVLYVTYRYDPTNPMDGSGADYQFYSAIKNEKEFSVKIDGPTITRASFLERIVRRLYRSCTRKQYMRFPLSKAVRASRSLNRAEKAWRPDVVFTLSPAPLVHYSGKAPCIYRIDSTTEGSERYNQRNIGPLALKVTAAQEKNALAKCKRVITHSDWCKQDLIHNYGVDAAKIEMFTNPAALPRDVVPKSIDVRRTKRLAFPLRILLVGRSYRRKGIDIAVEIVRLLNVKGVPSRLTVCGHSRPSGPFVDFVGLYDKRDSSELCQYASHYQQAHLLLHPARFDPSPIVTSEAAAYGVPTVTNSAGGIATSVKDGVSGIVLAEGSEAPSYVRVIEELVRMPHRYYQLCKTTRERFERELNWEIAGEYVIEIIREVADTRG